MTEHEHTAPGPSRSGLRADIMHPRVETQLAGLFETIDLSDRVVARCTTVPSPLGEAVVCWTDLGVSWLRLRQAGMAPREVLGRLPRPVKQVDEAPLWLRSAVEHADGRDVQVDLTGLSDFQQQVLQAASQIPRGQTRPYAWIAEQVGRPQAVRAVGTALGHNPVPLLMPCHRVVRSDGSTGQYIFGAAAKQHLLELEGVG